MAAACPKKEISPLPLGESLAMVHALYEAKNGEGKDEFIVFTNETHYPFPTALNNHDWTIKSLQPSSFRQLVKNMIGPIIGEERLYKAWELFHYGSRSG